MRTNQPGCHSVLVDMNHGIVDVCANQPGKSMTRALINPENW